MLIWQGRGGEGVKKERNCVLGIRRCVFFVCFVGGVFFGVFLVSMSDAI